MIRKFHNIIYFVLSFVVLVSCRDHEIPAPARTEPAVNITDSFTVSHSNIDFTTGDRVTFKAHFYDAVSWQIKIVGTVSGAEKIIEGTRNKIDSSLALWDGISDQAITFQREQVKVYLSFPYSVTDTVIEKSLIIDNIDHKRYVIAQFDTIRDKAKVSQGPDALAGWPSDNIPSGIKFYTDTVSSQVEYYYELTGGKPWQTNAGCNCFTPYIDFISFPVNSVTSEEYYPLYGDPSRVWFNVDVKDLYKVDTSGALLRILFEEEGGNVWSYDINTRGHDWKRYSVNYAKLTSTSTSAPKPFKLQNVRFVLLTNYATPEDSPAVGVAIDNVQFSFDGPVF